MGEKIEKLKLSEPDSSKNFKEWDLGFMCDYIVNTHHKYVLKTLPELLFYTEKIAAVHGDRHSELVEIATLFSEINRELNQHLKNEEEVLFPAIKDIIKGKSAASAGIIINEISRMTTEHEFAGGAMDRINEMTGNYSVPADGCNTYNVAFRTLKQFEDDLHIHVHLENNILYPGALKIANQ
jgi:regulator of cell morphogenesis and NO signaling